MVCRYTTGGGTLSSGPGDGNNDFEVERYEDSYRLCYVRSPEGIIVELVEQIG